MVLCSRWSIPGKFWSCWQCRTWYKGEPGEWSSSGMVCGGKLPLSTDGFQRAVAGMDQHGAISWAMMINTGSFIPRPLPAFECCTLKGGKQHWNTGRGLGMKLCCYRSSVSVMMLYASISFCSCCSWSSKKASPPLVDSRVELWPVRVPPMLKTNVGHPCTQRPFTDSKSNCGYIYKKDEWCSFLSTF